MASAAYMDKGGADWIRGDRCEHSTFIWFAEGTEENIPQAKEARTEFYFSPYRGRFRGVDAERAREGRA
jgi:hypothetical protein